MLLPLVMHTAQNTFGGELAGPMFSGADVAGLSWLRGGIDLLAALVLVLRDGRLRTGAPAAALALTEPLPPPVLGPRGGRFG